MRQGGQNSLLVKGLVRSGEMTGYAAHGVLN